MLVLGGTLLTHTFALLSIVPLLVSLVIFRLAQAWRQVGVPWRRTLLAVAGGLGGLLLCSIFILPLLAEGRYLQQQVYVTDTYDFRNHFVQIGQFFSPFWGFGFSDDPKGANDGMSFQVGAAAGAGHRRRLWLAPGQGGARRAGLPAGDGRALLFVMTPLAQPLWEAFPPLAVIQFPWRLLALTGFLFSALGGLLLANLALDDFADEVQALLAAATGARSEPCRRAVRLCAARHLCQLALSAGQSLARRGLARGWARDLPFRAGTPRYDRLHPVGDAALYLHGHERRLCRARLCRGSRLYDQPRPPADCRRRRHRDQPLQPWLERRRRGGHGCAGTVQINFFYFPAGQVTVDGLPVQTRPSPTGAILVDMVPGGTHRRPLWRHTTAYVGRLHFRRHAYRRGRVDPLARQAA